MKSELVPRIRFGEFEGEWEKKAIGSGVKYLSGYAFDGKMIVEEDVGPRLIRGASITEGYVRDGEEVDRFYSGNAKGLEKYIVHTGDIVIGMDGSKVGRNSATVNDSFEGALLVQRVARLRETSKASLAFIYQHINSSYFHQYVDRVKTSSGIPHISSKHIKEFPIGFPTLPEQQKIAAFLTAVDGRLAGLRRQVAALERYKRGVMQGVFGDEVGGEWINVKVGKAYSFFSTNSLSRAKLNYETGECKNIHYGDIHTQFSQYLNVRKTTVPYITPGVAMKGAAYKHSVQAGDVLLADASEDINDIGKATEVVDAGDVPLYAGLHTIHARPKPGTIAPGFGTLLFQSPAFRRQVSKIAQGAKVLGISPTSIKEIQLRIPPLPEQRRIATFLRALDARIGLVEQQLAGAEAFKRGLLQGMFV